MVTLGHIDYLNCIPVHGAILLKRVPFQGQIIKGSPTKLNRLLEKGLIDISPSSSVEILKGHYIVPKLSISGKIDVQSIILFTKVPIDNLKKGIILLSNHSATSSMLVKLIFKELYNADLTYKTFNPHSQPRSNQQDIAGILHIGDIALKYNLQDIYPEGFLYKYDLAKIWYDRFKLPFVFAL